MERESFIEVFRDGDVWCACFVGFSNIQEDVCGFGATKEEATIDLLRANGAL